MAEMKRNLDEAKDEATAAALGQFSSKNILTVTVYSKAVWGSVTFWYL
jgi:hypothetical protein